MEKRSSFLFILLLTLVLGSLTLLNFFREAPCFTILDNSIIPAISFLLIVLIILLFIYREIENGKTENQFITIITHKIKAPLTGIRWTIDMLQKDLTLLEKKDLLMEMQKTNQRLMEIMDLLVHFARFNNKLDRDDLEAVSLKDMVDFSANKYEASLKKKNIQFSISAEKDLPLVMVDKAKIQFVVDMLIDNAIKYTPQDGQVKAIFLIDRKFITLEIKDSGIGIKKEDVGRIFKRFYRAENAKVVDVDGLGLGMYTSKKMVEHHGGQMGVKSEGLNKGSTFYIKLPIKS